ncbi:MAG: hypothetical protein HFJ06_01745 [Lachnospiraceae bacterium]|nr:hypothetical protein [Lachnospiraceae bacterium]
MVEIKNLIAAVQIMAVIIAIARIAVLKLQNLPEDDQRQTNRKIKNIVKAVIIIESIITIVAYLQKYYGFAM